MRSFQSGFAGFIFGFKSRDKKSLESLSGGKGIQNSDLET